MEPTMRIRRCAAATLLLLAGPAYAQQGTQEKVREASFRITVPASASIEVAPDTATIRLAVMIERKTSREAASENSRVATKLIEEIRAQQIEARDVRTIAVTVTPVYSEERDPSGRVVKRVLTGYRAVNSLEVRVRDIGKVGPLAQLLIDKGGNILSGIHYSVSDAEEHRDRLRVKAIQEAARRAKLYVDAIGVKLGRVTEIEPERDEGDGPLPAPRAMQAEAAPGAIAVEPGVQTLRARVTVTWQIAE
jgi:uncharacterized protein YggE